MMDPLSCLREYTIKKKSIVEKNSFLIFGQYCWPKSVKTNYQIFNKQKDAPEEYYSLECLFFLLKNTKLNHCEYVHFAQKNGVPFVRRPDRKKLLAYLMGEISTSLSINTSAPVVYPTKIKLEQEEDISDVSYKDFQNSNIMSPSEDVTSRKTCQSSLKPIIAVTEIEEQREIDLRPSEKNSNIMSPSEDVNLRNKCQSSLDPFIAVTVKQEIEEQREIDLISSRKNFNIMSPIEDVTSSNNCQSSLNPNIAVTVKQEIEEQREIDLRPSKKNSNIMSPSEDVTLRNKCQSSLDPIIAVTGLPLTKVVKRNPGKTNWGSYKEQLKEELINLTVRQGIEKQREIDLKSSKQNSNIMSPSEDVTSRKKYQSSLYHFIALIVRQEIEKQREIDLKSSEKNSNMRSPSEDVTSRNKCQSSFNRFIALTVRQELEKQREIDLKSSKKELFSLSSTETSILKNKEHFFSLQREKQVNEDTGRINKKQRTEADGKNHVTETNRSKVKVEKDFMDKTLWTI